MPRAQTYQPGDYPYDQYTEVFSLPLDSGIAVTKGQVLTISGSGNNSGHLVLPPTTAGVPDLRAGLFQAMESVPSQTNRGRTVQVLANGSRMVFRAEGSVHWGQRVQLGGTGTTPSNFGVPTTAAALSSNAYLGRIVEISTLDSSRDPKYVAAANDTIIVQTGVA